jgi:type II secretory pathway pseudopilin PulG
MLIVMGIMIILMAVGIAGAKFALQRANKIQHQSAVDSMYQALHGYYSDNRKYPVNCRSTGGYNAKVCSIC